MDQNVMNAIAAAKEDVTKEALLLEAIDAVVTAAQACGEAEDFQAETAAIADALKQTFDLCGQYRSSNMVDIRGMRAIGAPKVEIDNAMGNNKQLGDAYVHNVSHLLDGVWIAVSGAGKPAAASLYETVIAVIDDEDRLALFKGWGFFYQEAFDALELSIEEVRACAAAALA